MPTFRTFNLSLWQSLYTFINNFYFFLVTYFFFNNYASIFAFFIITISYKRGKRDGINQTIDYFVTEMNRKKIDIEVINSYDIIEKKAKLEIFKKIRHLPWRKKNE